VGEVELVGAAVGFATHSGWAVGLVVELGGGHLRVHDRRRIDLISPDLPRQAYHAAAELPSDAGVEVAAEVVAAVDRSIAEHARQALTAIQTYVDLSLVAVGVVGRPRQIPDVATVLASHALMHASEGEQYRRGLAEAAERIGLPVCRADPRRLEAAVADAIGWSPSRLADEHARVRAALGPPWQKDHKDATAAALIALAGCRR
jgi:hypothetical protein